jgi:hypothetical protein
VDRHEEMEAAKALLEADNLSLVEALKNEHELHARGVIVN